MTIECAFCKKYLSTSSSLKLHQKTAKYCLKVQGQNDPGDYECKICKDTFYLKAHLLYHEKSCKDKDPLKKYIKIDKNELADIKNNNKVLNDELKNLQEKNLKFEEDNKKKTQKIIRLQIELDIVRKDKEILQNGVLNNIGSKNTNNITINQNKYINSFLEKAEPITDIYLKNSIDNLTLELHKLGIQGYSQYIDYTLKNRIICTDHSRKKIKYKDEHGTIREEIGHGNLFTNIFENISDKSSELSKQHKYDLSNKFDQDEIDVYDFEAISNDIKKSCKGSETHMTNRIIDKICKKNTVKQLVITE